MLLAEESTQVAEKNQDGRPAKQIMRAEDFAIHRHQIEVEIDPHRTMMRSPERPYVIRITERPEPLRPELRGKAGVSNGDEVIKSDPDGQAERWTFERPR